MDKEQLQQYVFRYFQATGSHVLEASPGHLRVQLSEQADKDLTNRPLYWAFVERTGTAPQTMTMTFIFDREQAPKDTEGEDLRFGSPRLLQMFSSAARHGRWTRLYENPNSARGHLASAVPWLGINCNVQYVCDRKRDEIHSLGVNLVTGAVTEHFMEQLKTRSLTPRLPPRLHVVPTALSLDEAVDMVRNRLIQHIQAQDDRWAQEARERMTEEIERIRQFYESLPRRASGSEGKEPPNEKDHDEWTSAYEKHLDEVKWQYEPRVHVELINAGLFYLLS